jgi:glycosyltransferase involved in cell wall biosynthesis
VSTKRVLEILGRSAGGVGRHVAEITKALDGHGGLLIDVAAPANLTVPMPKPVLPVDIPDGPLLGHFSAIRRLRSIIDEHGHDLVHAHGLRAGIDGALAARWAKVPAVVTLHNLVRSDISGGLRGRAYRMAEPAVVRLGSKVFVPSAEMAEHLASVAPGSARKIEVLYAGVAEPPQAVRSRVEVRRELGAGNDDGVVVTVARLHPQKALHVLLRAVAKLDAAVLVVIGDGPLEGELKGLARALGIAERVRWLGYRGDVADYIAAADAFSLSSLWEAVPLAAQEAVLLGVPVVATDVGGLGELIADGVSGRLVPKNDDGALAEALRQTLESPGAAREFARRALADYGTRFSRDEIIARLKEVYCSDAP